MTDKSYIIYYLSAGLYQMTFKEALESLFSGCKNKKNNLAEVKNTAIKLGLIPLKFKAVHIAGTNGKGTTAALLADILEESGFKTGLFTSPHILSPLERIKINNKNISEKAFAESVSFIKENQTAELNFFEVLTLASLHYFTKQKVNYAVVECGIGGLLDSTNIINPVLSIITSIDLDHCSMLGATIREISTQKSGIIKPGVPALAGRLSKDAFTVVKEKSNLEKAPLFKVKKIGNFKQDFKKLTSSFTFKNTEFKTRLLGLAQNQNAALATEAAIMLGVDIETCRKICRQFTIPCRFEALKLRRNKFLIKDGAHNPAALKEFLKTYKKSCFYNAENTLVFAASADHDYKKLCSLIKPHFKNILLICPDAARNISAEVLAEEFKNKKISFLRDISAFNVNKFRGSIIVCGSFYLCALFTTEKV